LLACIAPRVKRIVNSAIVEFERGEIVIIVIVIREKPNLPRVIRDTLGGCHCRVVLLVEVHTINTLCIPVRLSVHLSRNISTGIDIEGSNLSIS
jgi:hypothetical protein